MRNCWFVVAVALLVSGCDSGLDEPANGVVAASGGVPGADPTPGSNSTARTIERIEGESRQETLTGPQKNAVRSAEQYLSMTGFSRDGLIEQLSSEFGEGYSVSDATAAVDSINVDWDENAVKSARQYLDLTGFSCGGLIEQLSSSAGDKYTVGQATYGATQAGAC